MFLLIIVWSHIFISTMQTQDDAYKLKFYEINRKKFIVPEYDLFGCEKYMLPKLGNAPVHHTFFAPQEIEQVYKQMNVDTQKLNHNLDKDKAPQIDKPKLKMGEQPQTVQQKQELTKIEQKPQQDKLNKGRKRPPLRQKGYTHFIHIPLVEVLRKVYTEEIYPRIEEEDRDILMPLESMHMTVMVFRLKKQEDLPKWKQVLRSAKKTKINIQGVNFFPVKNNYGRVFYINIKGIDQFIDTIVRKAIENELITEQELSYIKFDKTQGIYKAQPHISLLRTQGEDLLDFSYYMKALKHINVRKVNINEIRLSMIDTHNGEDYYNEDIHYF